LPDGVFVYGPVKTGPATSVNPLFVPLTFVVDCSVKVPAQFNTTLVPTRLMLMAPGAPLLPVVNVHVFVVVTPALSLKVATNVFVALAGKRLTGV
jgi:hypothetical protein